jgi:hypothetical protein
VNPAQALHDAQRIGASLLARLPAPVTGVPFASPRVPAFALPPKETGERVCQAMTLTAPPGVDVFGLIAEDMRQNGVEPHAWSSPDGEILVGVLPGAGFVLVLRRHAGRAELYVVSPILPKTGAGLYAGIAAGAVVGLVGPCFSTLTFQRLLGDQVAYLGFVPVVLLLGGALLISPDTRQFGVGLLIGGAITGIVTAGICSAMLGGLSPR